MKDAGILSFCGVRERISQPSAYPKICAIQEMPVHKQGRLSALSAAPRMSSFGMQRQRKASKVKSGRWANG
jgi:hypothetical protein